MSEREAVEAMRDAAITSVLKRVDELTLEMEGVWDNKVWERLLARKQEAEYIIAVCLDRRALPLPEASPDPRAWECAARKQSLLEPGECDWPFCGCDPVANKVIEHLQECGRLTYKAPVPDPCDEAAKRHQGTMTKAEPKAAGDEIRALLASRDEALRLARSALLGAKAEWDKLTRYGSPIAKDANENFQRVNKTIAAIDQVIGGAK